MKILLCLLSDQHVPNLLSVRHFQPHRLVLLESAGMKEKHAAANFLEAVQLDGSDYSDRCDTLLLKDENHLDVIRPCLQQAFAQQPDAQWVVNLTGGTKPMSIASYEFFRPKQARLVYASLNRPNEFLDFSGQPTETCSHRLTIQEFLAGYGFQFVDPLEDVLEAEKSLRFLPPTAQLIVRHAAARGVLPLSEERRRAAHREGIVLEPGELRVPNEELRKAIAKAFRLRADGDDLRGRLAPLAGKFLTGGWLEVFLWDLLKRHAAQLGLWNVHVGLRVLHRETNSENELDVAFMHDYTLHMVECKSGSQRHDRDVDVLYKVDAVTRQFRALRARGYLAITADTVFGTPVRGQPAVKKHLAGRAELYGARIITRDQIECLAADVDNVEQVRNVFFG